MYLTKKHIVTIVLRTLLFAVMAVALFMMSDKEPLNRIRWLTIPTAVFSGIYAVLDPFIAPTAFGVSPFISEYNYFVEKELRPAAFIEYCNRTLNGTEFAVKKPDFDVLSRVLCAYELLGDEESAEKIRDEMLSTQKGKKLTHARLVRIDRMFELGQTEEADAELAEIERSNPDMLSRSIIANIRNSSRAKALGDYITAETFYLLTLRRSGKKKGVTLNAHYSLGKLYKELGRTEDAREHLCYCVENGGECVMKTDAAKLLEELTESA